MLSSQHPPLPPQTTFHRAHKLLPGAVADKAPPGGMRDLEMDDEDDVEAYIGDRALRKPSRLEQMRADYQKMLLKKKEEKMVQVFEENQKKSMSRMARVGSGGGHTVPASPQGNVRGFFNERRRLAASGAPIPPINNHYRQVKGYSSPAGLSSRAGSGSSVNTQKSSAGRDRAHPLAPIQRAQETSEAPSHNGRSGIPLRRQTNDQGDDNPFDVKPKMVKHQPLPARNVLVDNNNNGGAKVSALPRFNPGNRTLSQPNLAKSPQANRMPFPPAEDPAFRGQGGKLTEFQKWQLEQNKARENRLKKLNHRQQDEGADGDWRDPEEDPRFEDRSESGHDEVDESSLPNAKIKELEKQLLEKIAKEQSELKRIQMERKKEEEEERKEIERQQKKEAAERARLKKLEDDRKKEEERRHKKEEEERFEREREEKQRLLDEQQRKGRVSKTEERAKLKTVDKRVKEEYIDDEDEEEEESRYTQIQPHPPEKAKGPAKRLDPRQTRSKASVHEREDPEAAPTTDANYYLQAAASSDAKGSVGHLEKCSLCGRSFAPERLAKHETACRKANKPRKEFDSSKKRVEGTELAKYAGKAKRPEPPKKKSNWRAQHHNFIESLRYAKKVTQIEKEGGDLRQLAPPPRTIDPGLVPCPHCGRKFNETAAERHIPRCKDLKTRPPPMNTRRK